jgi:hypothetical protein
MRLIGVSPLLFLFDGISPYAYVVTLVHLSSLGLASYYTRSRSPEHVLMISYWFFFPVLESHPRLFASYLVPQATYRWDESSSTGETSFARSA